MKKNKMLKTLLFVLLLAVIATWFIPTTNITDGKFVTEAYNRIGVFQLSNYVAIVIANFFQYSFYLIFVGGLYGVMSKLPAYKKLTNLIAKGFKNREWIFFITVGLFLALVSSMTGLSFGLLILLPILVSIVLAMGYDKMTAAILFVGSVIAGLMGTVFSANNVLGMIRVLGIVNQEEFINGQVLIKLVIMAIALFVVVGGAWLYAKEHKGEPEKLEEDVEKAKVWPLSIVLDLTLVVLILGFISWTSLKVDFFDKFVTSMINPTGSPLTKGIVGGINSILGMSVDTNSGYVSSFGNWSLVEASVVVLIATVVLAVSYKVKYEDFLDDFLEGAKKALVPAMMVLIAYTVFVVLHSTNITNGVLRYLMHLGSGIDIVPTSVVFTGFSTLGIDQYWSAIMSAEYVHSLLPTGELLTLEQNNFIGLLWQSMYGLTMFVAPTSAILVAVLSSLEISYKNWLKSVWKILLAIYVLLVLILYIYR